MKRRRRFRLNWTPEEDVIVFQDTQKYKTAAEIASTLPGRSTQQVHARRHALGLKKYELRPWTEEDEQALCDMWRDFVDRREIAKKLKRTVMAINLRIHMLGLKRDGRKTKLARRFGVEILTTGSVDEITRRMAEQKVAEKEQQKRERAESIQRTLDECERAVANGESREDAFRAAMIKGCALQDIGTRFDLTRERVRQLTDGDVHRLLHKFRQMKPQHQMQVFKTMRKYMES